MPRAVVELAPDRDALGDERLRLVEVAAAVGVRAQPVEDRRARLVVAVEVGDRERLAEIRVAERVVALVRREQPGAGERLASNGRRRLVADRERGGEPQPALGEVAARPPELGEGPGEPQRERPVALLGRPLERLADVVVRGVQPVEGIDLAVGREVHLGRLDEREHLVRVGPADRHRLAALGEPVERVGADRREHLELAGRARGAQQRGVHELAQAVADVDADGSDPAPLAALEDRRRRRGGERAGDYRDPTVEAEDRLREQAEAPVHRRAQAPLARRDRRPPRSGSLPVSATSRRAGRAAGAGRARGGRPRTARSRAGCRRAGGRSTRRARGSPVSPRAPGGRRAPARGTGRRRGSRGSPRRPARPAPGPAAARATRPARGDPEREAAGHDDRQARRAATGARRASGPRPGRARPCRGRAAWAPGRARRSATPGAAGPARR